MWPGWRWAGCPPPPGEHCEAGGGGEEGGGLPGPGRHVQVGRQGLQEGDHLPGQVRQAGGQGSAANFPFWPGGFDPPQVQGVVWWWW